MTSSISSLSYYQDVAAQTQQLATQLNTVQAEASTGQKYAKVSDNPTASLAILSSSDQEQLIGAHLSNIQAATSNLNASVSALQQVDTLFSQAQSLALQAGNATNNSASIAAMGQQVNGIINSLLGLANSQNGNTYVFGGTGSNSQPPFTVSSQDDQGNPQAVTYNGDANGTSAIIGTDQQVATNYPGSSVFGGGQGSSTTDAFQTLITLRDTLLNAANQSSTDLNQALKNSSTALQNVQTQVQTVIGQQSASLQSMSTLQTQLQNLQTSDKQTESTLGNADMTSVVVQLQSYEQQLQLSFEAFTQISSTSLLSFLH